MAGFASLPIAIAFFQENRSWDAQSRFAVDTAAFHPSSGEALFRIAVQRRDFVSQELGRIPPRVRNQCLFRRKSETQFLAEEAAQVSFDFLCFDFWPGECQTEVG